MEARDQPPADKILSKGTPLELAALTEADLVPYALKTLVSIPELLNTCLIHLLMVSLETARYGLLKLISSFVSSPRRGFVTAKYFWR